MVNLQMDPTSRVDKVVLAAALFMLWLIAGTATAFAYTPPDKSDDDLRLTSLSKAVAKAPARFLIESDRGRAGAEVAGTIEIRHTRELIPVVAPSFYTPKDVVIASVPFRTQEGEYAFSYAFWDAGTYSLTVSLPDNQGSLRAIEVKVAPEPAVLRSTMLLYGGLILLGLLAGVIGGVAAGKRDGRKSGERPGGGGAAALTVMVLTLLLAPVAARADAHEHGPTGSAPPPGHISAAQTQAPIAVERGTVYPREPVTLRISGEQGTSATLKIRHLEDDIVLFEGNVAGASGDAKVDWIFPEGNQYELSSQGGERRLSVQAAAPSFGNQAVGFVVLFSAFIIPMLVGFFACKGIWSSIERRKNG